MLEGGWHDREVTVSLRASDGQGSGTEVTEYRVNPEGDDDEWLPYEGPFQVAEEGENVVEYRSEDVAGNVEDTKERSLLVDVTAPVTAVRINGAEPVADYTDAVRIAFARTDEPGLGTVETEYRIGDGEWTAYEGAFDISDFGGYRLDFRSIDLAGNVENYRTVTFAIRRPVTRRRSRRTSSRRPRRRPRRARSRRWRRSPRRCGRCPPCAAAGSSST